MTHLTPDRDPFTGKFIRKNAHMDAGPSKVYADTSCDPHINDNIDLNQLDKALATKPNLDNLERGIKLIDEMVELGLVPKKDKAQRISETLLWTEDGFKKLEKEIEAEKIKQTTVSSTVSSKYPDLKEGDKIEVKIDNEIINAIVVHWVAPTAAQSYSLTPLNIIALEKPYCGPSGGSWWLPAEDSNAVKIATYGIVATEENPVLWYWDNRTTSLVSKETNIIDSIIQNLNDLNKATLVNRAVHCLSNIGAINSRDYEATVKILLTKSDSEITNLINLTFTVENNIRNTVATSSKNKITYNDALTSKNINALANIIRTGKIPDFEEPENNKMGIGSETINSLKTETNNSIKEQSQFSKEITAAGYRVASRQITSLATNLLAAKIPDSQASVKNLFQSEIGVGIVSLMLGWGLTYAVPDQEKIQSLAKECRVSGLTTFGNVAIEALMGELISLISRSVEAIPMETDRITNDISIIADEPQLDNPLSHPLIEQLNSSLDDNQDKTTLL